MLCMTEMPESCLCIEHERPTWAPLFYLDNTLSTKSDGLLFTSWATSYFDHADLSTHNKDLLEYQAPSLLTLPTIYKLSLDELGATLDGAAATAEKGWLGGQRTPMVATYNKACFDRQTRARYPKMKVVALSCERSIGICVEAFWTIQRHNAGHGGDFVNFESIPGANHFVRHEFLLHYVLLFLT
jgi:hypothetical protein